MQDCNEPKMRWYINNRAYGHPSSLVSRLCWKVFRQWSSTVWICVAHMPSFHCWERDWGFQRATARLGWRNFWPARDPLCKSARANLHEPFQALSSFCTVVRFCIPSQTCSVYLISSYYGVFVCNSLLVLDEMDQLDSKSQEVLYTIFEWPYLPNSRVCLIGKIVVHLSPHMCELFLLTIFYTKRVILDVCLPVNFNPLGIANALDLTDRILPRLQAKPHCRPKLLNFPPYSREELNAIVQDRLTQVCRLPYFLLFVLLTFWGNNTLVYSCVCVQVSGEGVLDAAAVQFCARKVSAVSGDARKVLDICR